MTFIKRVKTIDTAALRAHPAFPLIVIGWMVLLFGAAAYMVKGAVLYALLGAIAGGLVGRYIVTRIADGQAEAEAEDQPETERDKRLRRVLGPDTDEEPAAPQAAEDDNPDADLERILASRESRPAPIYENGDREFLDDETQDTAEASDIPEPTAIDEEGEPQYLTIEELQLDEADQSDEAPAAEPQAVEIEIDAGDDGQDDGSDDFGPPESPEWSDPGAALAEMRNSNEQGSVDWEQYSRGSEPENAYDAYEGWTVEALENAGDENAADDIAGNAPEEVISDPQSHMALASDPQVEPPVAPQVEAELDVRSVPAPQLEPETEPEPESEAQAAAEPGENAVAKLRSQDLSQMSLVQMIERLAFAMDDYREVRDRKLAMGAHAASEPDPAIAEALRALPALSRAAGVYATDGNAALDLSTREEAEATEDALREALEKLQRLSGG